MMEEDTVREEIAQELDEFLQDIQTSIDEEKKINEHIKDTLNPYSSSDRAESHFDAKH